MGAADLTFVFSYSFDDFRRMQRHYQRHQTKRWQRIVLFSTLATIITAIITVSLVLHPRGNEVLLAWLKIFAVLGIILLAVFWTRRRAVKMAWLQQRRMLELEHRITIQSDGIAIDTIFSTTFHKWFGFEKFSMDDHIVLIYFNITSVIMLPRRIMSPDQVAAIVRILEAQLGPKTGAFPVQTA